MKKNTYFISGGGTGGHIYPAVSIMKELLNEEDTGKIFYIGNPENMEYKIVKQYDNVTFLPVNINGMPRKISFGFIKWLCKLEISLWKGLYYTLKYKPDVVFTTGGYVSAPIAMIAGLLKKPLIIHDCDAAPGLVTKTVAPCANIVSVAFEAAMKKLNNDNIHCFGNPVRKEFFEISKEDARGKLGLRNKMTILAMGGSQGAKTINNVIIQTAQKIVEEWDIQLILQTGTKNYDEVVKKLDEYFPNWKQNTNLKVVPFFNEMYLALKSADLVISRSGSLSLSEINACGLPAILVPYPYAAANHQFINASEAQNKGYAICIEDKDFSKETFINTLENISDEKLKDMSKKSFENAKPNSNKKIIEEIKKLVK